MDTYLLILRNSNEKKAKKLLEKNLYPNSTITYAKSLLDACPKNAVLYTWEEMDTYPLYYLQANQSYRDDVIIINISLAPSSKYMKMVYKGPYKSKALETSIPDKVFNKTTIVYNMVKESSDSTALSPKEFFNLLSDNENYTDYDSSSQHVLLQYDKLVMKLNHLQDKESLIELSLPRFYFFDLISQIDILYTYKNKRPILMSKHLPVERREIFSKIKYLGNVYQIGE